MKLQFSLLGMALALCAAAPVSAQTLATWASPVNVAATDGSLVKNGGCGSCPDAGAHSVTQLLGDGYADFVPGPDLMLFAGLGKDLSASTAPNVIDFAIEFSPGSTWGVRELGVYKTEGAYTAGDHFRVGVENGVVVYRRNGLVIYTSKTAPSYPLAFDTTLYTSGASLSGAVVVAGSATTTTTTGTGGSGGTPVVTSVGTYIGVVDRLAYAKPPVPVLGPAGTSIVDPTFSSTITRITDGATRPGVPNRSFRTPSSAHQNAWSAAGSYFYVVSDDGTAIPFTFDAATGSAARVQPTATGAGGLTLNFYIEPQFSYVNNSIIYGSYNGSGATLHTIDQYDFSSGLYSHVVDLDSIVSGLAGTYIGGLASSSGPTERILTFFGGASQDHHHYALIFDRANPSNRLLVDTQASTVNGAPASIPLNFSLHAISMDRTGRYVMLYPTSADLAAPRLAPPAYVWDTQTNTFTAETGAALPYGHDTYGFGVGVNQACCTTSTYDAAQWQIRSLANPLSTRDLIKTVIQPKEVYLADHSNWNNARPDRLVPFIDGTYRYGTNTTDWRAWDDEIIAVETDTAPGAESTVWRFAHHRSDVRDDTDATRTAFWYEPRPIVSPDGRWVIFTSNWEKTLGTDPAGDAGAGARQDVFLLELKTTGAPLSLAATPLASGRVSIAYTAALQAAGGSGTYSWRLAGGALPPGLSLDPATGVISGTPTAGGTFAFTVAVTDALVTGTAINQAFSIAVVAAPLRVATAGLAGGRVGSAYSASLSATGSSGSYVWAVSARALPPGLALNSLTGAVSGTPTAVGTFTFSVAVSAAADPSNTAGAPLSITIGAAPVCITTVGLPGGRATNAYAAAETAAGGMGSFRWTATGLPAGVSINATSGKLSGAPATAGTYTVRVNVADGADASNVASAGYAVAIAPAITITSPRTIPGAGRGVFYSYAVQTANALGIVKWDLAGGALPPEMTLNATTGVVSGTCMTPGTYYFNVRVKDSSTNATLTLGLVVK